ncbi:mediator of RNA polymerase II transcription subunit 28 [Apteryx rowi]|uniref:mediator of RNA polymerase II transcription subunit 28 n=1 Tax=Apteryx rowi TaxID=308060 RepID=UPI0006B0AADC|nr:PREDICTED: mediator of RNA polymerase II transcription subunit 28 [Apteryx mantelli mantelli]XP_025931446.1 mediator of RNA polymerase II transcription subunit 28 [Apteryx rowi]
MLPKQLLVWGQPDNFFSGICSFNFAVACLGVDQCIQKFLDVARQTECFFLQKRLQLSVQKPDQVIKEDVSELRNELQRKEALIQKHLGKLRHWQQVLEDISVQHKKPAEMPQGPLAYLEQASANIPAPMKQT